MKYKALYVILMSAVLLQGCSINDGGTNINKAPTVGQELIDLDRAHSTGAINDEEYFRLKDTILDR